MFHRASEAVEYLSAIGWIRRGGEYPLIKDEVKPSAEFEAGVPNRAAMLKTKPLMQAYADDIAGIDCAYDHVVFLPLCCVDDLLEQTFADTVAPKARIDIDRVLD